MTDVIVTAEDVIVTVAQPVIPPTALPVAIGLVEIDQIVQRGSIWLTGSGPPTTSGGQIGDLYLDVDTGNIYRWEGTGWVYQGTFAPSTDTPAEVLAKLVTVDGSGSGLDADLLDGHDSPYFATQADMTTAQSNISSNTTAITTNTGNINTNTTNIATNTTAISTETTNRQNADTTLQANINLKANIASPVFTGDPQAPTPVATDNDTSIATTQFVTRALAALPPSGIPEAPNDGKTYGRKSLAWATVVSGANIGDSPPPAPVNGQLYWKSSTGQFFIWYDDGNSQQWVQVFTQPPNPGGSPWRLIANDEIAPAGTLAWIKTNLDAYRTLQLEFSLVHVSTLAGVSMQYSSDNGATWISSAGAYVMQRHWGATATASASNASFTVVPLTGGNTITANGVGGSVIIHNWNQPNTRYKLADISLGYATSGPAYVSEHDTVFVNSIPCNALQVFSGQLFTGRITLSGVPA